MKNNPPFATRRVLSTARLSFPLASAITALFAAQSVHAGNTWDGTGGTAFWNTNANWNGDTAPSTGTALTFAGNVQNSTTNNLVATDPSFAGIFFNNNGAGTNTNAFTLAGSRITLGGNITTTANTAGSTITDIISLEMILNGDRTITTNQQSASVQHNLNVSGAISSSGAFGLTKAGGGTLNLSGANTYTGATTLGTAGSVASGGLLTVSGAAGTINASSGYTINGSGSRLLLDNTAGNVDRLKNTSGVTLNLGGELSLTGNGTANSTETIASLSLGTGSSIVTVASAASRVSTLALTGGISRTNLSTALVRGASLDQSAGTNVSRITLGTAPSGADFVGTNTLSGGAVSDATKALKIVPWLFGDTTVAGTGRNFVTYDSTLGLRVLNATEMDTLSAGSTTAANPVNALAFNGTVTTSGLTVNSLLFNTNAQTLNGSGALTVNSGAVASVVSSAVIGSGYSSLVLGNGEGILTSTTGTTTINTPIDVTSGGGLTKTGGGPVILGASNLYTGQTIVNQGQLAIGTGTAGDLGSNTANIVLNGGNLSSLRTDAGLTLSNIISGSGQVLGNTAGGTLTLSGANTYTGATTVSAGTLTLTGNRTVTATGGYSVSGTGTQTLNIQGGNYGLGGNFVIGSNSTGATTVNHSAGTISSVANGIIMGNGSGTSNSFYNLSGTGSLTSASIVMGSNSGTSAASPHTSTIAVSDTGALTATTLRIGRYDFAGVVNTTNTFTQTGGTTTITNLGLGGSSTNAGNSTGPIIANLNLTGGTFTATTFASLSAAGNTTSSTNADSSSINIGGTAQVTLAAFPTARGTNSTANITFDTTTGGGGFLAPAAASATYMPANTFTNAFLTANGANFNVVGGKDITIGQALQNASGAAGALTKIGNGNLTLSGNNTYTGGLSINAGTVVIGTATSVNALGAGTVTIGDSANTGAAATLQFTGIGAFPGFANPIAVTGNGTSILRVTSHNPIFNAGVTLSNNLTIASNNFNGSQFTFNGGVTGTGNITVSINNTSNVSRVTFGTSGVNNTGTLTFNNDIVLGGAASSAATTGVNTISGGVGANVTGINQGSATNPLTISGAVATGASGKVLNSTAAALFTVSGGTAGTGNVTFNANSTGNFTVSTGSVNHTGTITNSGTGAGITTISGVIGTNVTSVTQNSATSTLILSGVNTYTGDTTVSGGVLAVNGSSIADTNKLVISGTGKVNLTNAETVNTLFFGATLQPRGTYRASHSSTNFTGSGTLIVTDGPVGDPYSIWANTFLPSNDVSNPAGDNDNDGMTNQQEFAFGLSPINGSSVNPIIAQPDQTSGTFTYQRRADTGLTYKILRSTDLVTWSEDSNAVQSASATDGNGNQTVGVTLTGDKPLTAAKLFVRVAAVAAAAQ